MSTVAHSPWIGFKGLVIGMQVQTEGCPVKWTSKQAATNDGEDEATTKGTGI